MPADVDFHLLSNKQKHPERNQINVSTVLIDSCLDVFLYLPIDETVTFMSLNNYSNLLKCFTLRVKERWEQNIHRICLLLYPEMG